MHDDGEGEERRYRQHHVVGGGAEHVVVCSGVGEQAGECVGVVANVIGIRADGPGDPADHGPVLAAKVVEPRTFAETCGHGVLRSKTSLEPTADPGSDPSRRQRATRRHHLHRGRRWNRRRVGRAGSSRGGSRRAPSRRSWRTRRLRPCCYRRTGHAGIGDVGRRQLRRLFGPRLRRSNAGQRRRRVVYPAGTVTWVDCGHFELPRRGVRPLRRLTCALAHARDQVVGARGGRRATLPRPTSTSPLSSADAVRQRQQAAQDWPAAQQVTVKDQGRDG